MQKQCSRCSASRPLEEFNIRVASADGRTAACALCIRATKRQAYRENPFEQASASLRATAIRQQRFAADPAYKRAFHLWGTTKKRNTKIPPWVSITDFVPICRKAIKKGPGYVLDHVIPINHPLVCGLHVPSNLRVVKRKTNQAKGNSFFVI